jgi:hypothetical protein
MFLFITELLQMAGGDPPIGGQHQWRLVVVRPIEGKERRNLGLVEIKIFLDFDTVIFYFYLINVV